MFESRVIARRGHLLLNLASNLPSYIEFRKPGNDYRDFNESLFVADNTGYIHRTSAERFDGHINFYDKRKSKILMNVFEDMWGRSEPQNHEPVKLSAKLAVGLCLALGSSFLTAAEMTLEIIPLQFRNADEIIPIIRPLVQHGGTVTGMNNQLIVKTTASNLMEIKQILAQIDKAARRLLITVKQDISSEINTHEHGVSGRYSRGDVTLSSNNRPDNNRGLVLSAEDEDGNNIRYRKLSTRSDIDDRNTFQVQTIDGKAAYIQTGQQVPIANRNAYVTRGGVVVRDTIEYHDVSSGFYVLPRVNGDRVTLLVSPHLSRIKPNQGGVFEVQNAETTTVGRLGEWLQIGGVTQHFNTSNKEILRSTRQRGQEQRTILIKVEEIL